MLLSKKYVRIGYCRPPVPVPIAFAEQDLLSLVLPVFYQKQTYMNNTVVAETPQNWLQVCSIDDLLSQAKKINFGVVHQHIVSFLTD